MQNKEIYPSLTQKGFRVVRGKITIFILITMHLLKFRNITLSSRKNEENDSCVIIEENISEAHKIAILVFSLVVKLS